jgi:hypothetical protein
LCSDVVRRFHNDFVPFKSSSPFTTEQPGFLFRICTWRHGAYLELSGSPKPTLILGLEGLTVQSRALAKSLPERP